MRRFSLQWRRFLSHGGGQAAKRAEKVVALEELASVLPVGLPAKDEGEQTHSHRYAPRSKTDQLPRHQPSQNRRTPYFSSLLSSSNVLEQRKESPRSEALKALYEEGPRDPPLAEQMSKISLLDNRYIPSSSSGYPQVREPHRGLKKGEATRSRPALAAKASNLPISVVSKERLAYVPTTSSIKTFAEMRLPGWLLEALATRNIHQPTPTQQRLIETMLEHDLRKQFLYVRAQTGTGKSLGYIIALLAGLHRERLPLGTLAHAHEGWYGCLHLILVPNAILGLQLLRWIKSLVLVNAHWAENLAQIVKVLLPTEVFDDEYPKEVMGLSGNSHILIATPGQAQALLAQGRLSLGSLRNIIIDEVDAQLRPLSEYAPRRCLMNRIRHPNPTLTLLTQLYRVCEEEGLTPPRPILASATLNGACRLDLLRATGIKGAKYVTIDQSRAETVDAHGSAMASINGLNSHLSCPSSIRHYYRMLRDAESIEELLTLIKQVASVHEGRKGALFVPASKSKAAICEMVRHLGISSELISSMKMEPGLMVETEGRSNHCRLLIGSDVDARGWDMPSLAYVIIVDMPQSATHYLHMAGRVGRMGNPGTVYTVVAGHKDLERLTGIYSMLRVAATPFLP